MKYVTKWWTKGETLHIHDRYRYRYSYHQTMDPTGVTFTIYISKWKIYAWGTTQCSLTTRKTESPADNGGMGIPILLNYHVIIQYGQKWEATYLSRVALEDHPEATTILECSGASS